MNFSFPFTYSNTVKLLYNQKIDYDDHTSSTLNELSNNKAITSIKLINKSITFNYLSLFSIVYPVTINIEEQNDTLNIRYDIKLQRLIQISIIIVLFTAFFSSFGMGDFLWFSFMLLIAFYATNLIFVDVGIRNLIKSTGIYKICNPNDETDDFSDEQKQWLQDISRCPACGEHLQISDNTCPECGLRLPHQTIYKPFDASKYKNAKTKYKQNNK